MWDAMGSFDQAFAKSPGGQPPQLRMQKTLGEQIAFWGANTLLLPFIGVCYLVVSAEGLRQMMPVFATRLYKLPVPGAGLMRGYDGFDRLDLAIVMALLLCVAISFLWFRVFLELMGSGAYAGALRGKPVLFYLLASICGVILLGDATIFYFGLQSKAASGWSETPAYVPALATALYMTGLSLVGAWHADYHTNGTV